MCPESPPNSCWGGSYRLDQKHSLFGGTGCFEICRHNNIIIQKVNLKRIVQKFNFEIDNVKMVLIFVVHIIVTQSVIKGIFDLFKSREKWLRVLKSKWKSETALYKNNRLPLQYQK